MITPAIIANSSAGGIANQKFQPYLDVRMPTVYAPTAKKAA